MSTKTLLKPGPKIKPHTQRNNDLLRKLIAGKIKQFHVDNPTERKRLTTAAGLLGARVQTRKNEDGTSFTITLRN